MLHDDDEILSTLLFHVRTPVMMLPGIADIVLNNPNDLPVNATTWFRKWKPTIDQWVDKVHELNRYFDSQPDMVPDWENLIAQLGDSLSDIVLAESEIHRLILRDANDTQDLARQAIKAIERLKEIQQVIQNQAYSRIWEM